MSKLRDRDLMHTLSLDGLTPAASQVWGSVRIVPLLRDAPREDLRLMRRPYDADVAVVTHPGGGPQRYYAAYVPQGLVVSWGDDAQAMAATQTRVAVQRANKARAKVVDACAGLRVQVMRRMVQREGNNTLRLLPMHLAIEGFLSMHFGGPDIAWDDLHPEAVRYGMCFASTPAIVGHALDDLPSAVQRFELHEGQCGVLLFVGDLLASAFVVSHPDDYRALHSSVLDDLYADVLMHYQAYDSPPSWRVSLGDAPVASLAELGARLEAARAEWAAWELSLGEALLERAVTSARVYEAGPFHLERFITDLNPARSNHIGEALRDEKGQVQYLKTFALNAQQVRRASALSALASQGWSLSRAAQAQGVELAFYIKQLCQMGLGWLISAKAKGEGAS